MFKVYWVSFVAFVLFMACSQESEATLHEPMHFACKSVGNGFARCVNGEAVCYLNGNGLQCKFKGERHNAE